VLLFQSNDFRENLAIMAGYNAISLSVLSGLFFLGHPVWRVSVCLRYAAYNSNDDVLLQHGSLAVRSRVR